MAAFCSSSPLCGTFQVYGHPDVQEAILDVINGDVDIRDSAATSHFNVIKKYAPVLANAIIENMTLNDTISKHASHVMEYILLNILSLFETFEIPPPERYGKPGESPYEYFPCYPAKLGKCFYAIESMTKTDDIFCRKLSNSHPSLSPGVFTIFCRHRVCLGFSLMTSSESPKTPFRLFLSRFVDYLPQLRIIYDNSCNLHTYALNREPARFAETIFLVDRLHFQDHSACTLGYSTNSYNFDPKIKTLNTQINEQANADLRNLSKQISYMKPDNVMIILKLFLADRNRRVKT